MRWKISQVQSRRCCWHCQNQSNRPIRLEFYHCLLSNSAVKSILLNDLPDLVCTANNNCQIGCLAWVDLELGPHLTMPTTSLVLFDLLDLANYPTAIVWVRMNTDRVCIMWFVSQERPERVNRTLTCPFSSTSSEGKKNRCIFNTRSILKHSKLNWVRSWKRNGQFLSGESGIRYHMFGNHCHWYQLALYIMSLLLWI